MNLLVTGGTGFVGRRVINRIKKDNKTVIITRKERENLKNIYYHTCDLREIGEKDKKDILKLLDNKIDAIIYMAASIPRMGEKKETMNMAKENTLDPLVKFLDLFGEYVNKIIYTSTIDVVGIPENKYYDEYTNIKPITSYGVAKYIGEEYLNYYCRSNNKIGINLRLSQVYGPNEPLIRVIPMIKNCLLKNKIFTIYGTGEEKRRYLYVDDAAKAVQLSLKSNQSGTYNIAGKDIVSIKDVINIMEKVYGNKLRTKQNNDYEGFDNIPDIKFASKDLGFEPDYNFKRGVIKMNELERGN
jgi:UDP-glucose 4-epimerase